MISLHVALFILKVFRQGKLDIKIRWIPFSRRKNLLNHFIFVLVIYHKRWLLPIVKKVVKLMMTRAVILDLWFWAPAAKKKTHPM